MILDNLTTEIEKLCYEVYENCYRNESELEDDVKSEIDIEMIDGQDEKKWNWIRIAHVRCMCMI